MGIRVELGAVDNGLKSTTDAAGKAWDNYETKVSAAVRATRKLESAALRAVNQSTTGTQRLAQIRQGLNRLLEKGAITQEQYNQTLVREQQLLSSSAGIRKQILSETDALTKKQQTGTEKLIALRTRLNAAVKAGAITRADAANRFKAELKDQLSSVAVTDKQITKQGQLAKAVISTATAYVGIHQAIALANRLLTDQIQLESRLRQSELTIADAQTALIGNLGLGSSVAEQQRIVQKVAAIAPEVKIDEAAFTAAFAKTFSATSGDTQDRLEKTEAALRSVAPFFRTRPGELGDFAGALLDFQRSTSQQGINLNADESTSLLLQAQSQLRITDIANLKNIIPAIAAVDVTSKGTRLEDIKAGIAAGAAIGGRGGDTNGEQTRTAVALLAKVLEERVGAKDTFEQRVREVQRNPQLRSIVEEELLGRGAIVPTVKELLRGGSGDSAVTFDQVMKNLIIDSARFQEQRDFVLGGTRELSTQTFQAGSSVRASQALRNQQFGPGSQRAALFGDDSETFGAAQLASPIRRVVAKFVFDAVNAVAGPEIATDAAGNVLTRNALTPGLATGNKELIIELQRLRQEFSGIKSRFQTVEPSIPEAP